MSAEDSSAKRADWVERRNAKVRDYRAKKDEWLARRTAEVAESGIPLDAVDELGSYECAHVGQWPGDTGIEQIKFGGADEDRAIPLFHDEHSLSQRWDRLILAFDVLMLDAGFLYQGEMIDAVTACEDMLDHLKQAGQYLRTGTNRFAADHPTKTQDDGKVGDEADVKEEDGKVDTKPEDKKGKKKKYRKRKPRVK
ncbi:hypothetical protein HD806DRAFT_467481 [Xylariaceae sp. AK1471]|nr:hypothetical protein HD806DRAFT_467481 [Xylariaceae sp. AK1471]